MNSLSHDPCQLLSPLDAAHRLMVRGQVPLGLCRVFRELDEVHRRLPRAEFDAFAQRLVQHHPLGELIHQDPMCRRSFEKPRGYAGDAVLLDYLYGRQPLDGVGELGRAVHAFCSGRASVCAVRHRRDLLAHRIDRTADKVPGNARVLSVACGHLREADLSAAVQTHWLREIVGLDSDAESLAVAAAAHPDVVTPCHLSVRRLVARKQSAADATDQPMGKFHLIYSAGLYDYLEDAVAARLTARLFEMLERGGTLLLCNFLPSVPDQGFMETFMAWRLILRHRALLPRFLSEVPADQIADVRVFEDPFASVGYLEVTRTG